MTDAERSAAYRAPRKAETEAKVPVCIRYRRPTDKRTKPQRWADAVETLADLIEDYQAWRDSLPPSLADSPIATALFLGPSGSDERFIAACRQVEFSEQQCAFLEAAIRRRNAEDFITTHAAVSAVQ